SRESNILLSADYSQIELRILAHVSQDEQLIRAFREERDVHALTASKIFGVEPADVTPEQRDQAKVVNFGIIYGMSAPGLSQRLKIPLEQAKRFIAQYFEAYQGVKRWIEQIIQTARQFGYVTTLSGRRRYLADINSQNYNARAAAERMAINAPIQGSSADMIKLAMLDIHRWLKESDYQARMILQVHDELIFDVPEEELENILPEVRRRMENAMPLCVPVRVDCKWGKNWAEC
ncbi:MAG: DNA polymerase, partial [Candidatus Sumerlaeaceae bacterium]